MSNEAVATPATENNAAAPAAPTPAPAPSTPAAPVAVEVVQSDKEREELAVGRFVGLFELETETVGKSKGRKVKVSKSGGVTLSLLPMKSKTGDSIESLAKAANETPEAFGKKLMEAFRGDTAALIGRIQSSENWNPKNVKLNAKGNRINFEFESVAEAEAIVAEADAIKALAKAHSMSVEQVKEALELVKQAEELKAKAAADAKAAEEAKAAEAKAAEAQQAE